MKAIKLSLLAIFFIVTFISSCKDEGPGGRAIIKGAVKHHSDIIPNATVYIKYGATEFPGTTPADYDAQIVADASANFEFTNLVKGNYYLYAVGYDITIGQPVKGGVAVNIKRNENKVIDVPVTE